MYKNKPLTTAAFILPLFASMGSSAQANAACTVTAGSVAIPDDGSTVTCPAGETSTAQIGDGTTSATVVLEDGHMIDRTSATGLRGVYLLDGIVSLGDGAVIDTAANGPNRGITAGNDVTVSMGVNSRIESKYAITAGNIATVTLESGARLLGTDVIVGWGVQAGNQAIVTINANAEIIANYGPAIRGGTGAAGDFIDNSGLLQATNNSMQLRGGDDFLTLRTGSNLDSLNGADGGAGTDTVTLYGTNSEDEIFLNFEILDMEGDDWTLSGSSVFTTINVNSGTLSNDGTVAGDVNINPGTAFGGIGTTIGTITNDGTFSPGNSIGTHTITGAFNQTADGVLLVEFDDTSADLVDITGTAQLDGTARFSPLSGSIPDGTAFTALQTSGGIAGNFSAVVGTQFLEPVVTVGANNATVVINRLSFNTVSTTATQSAIGAALDQAILNDPAGIADVDLLFNTLTEAEAADLMASQSGLTQTGAVLSGTQMLGANTGIALTRVSGAPAPGMKTATFDGNSQTGISAGDAGAGLTETVSHTFWLQGTGAAGHTEGDAVARATSYRSYGFTAGVDTDELKNNSMMGVFFGYTNADGDVSGLRDDADTDIYQVGLYTGWSGGGLNLQGALSAAYLDYTTSRFTPMGIARADFSGAAMQASAEISRDIPRGGWVIAPLFGLAGTISSHDGYTESGAGALNMQVDADTIKQFSSALGMRLNRDVWLADTPGGDILLRTGGQIAWTHEFLDNAPDVSANFVASPTTAFSTSGPDRDRDALRFGLDLAAQRTDSDKFSLYLSYGGNVSGDAVNHALTAGMRIKW